MTPRISIVTPVYNGAKTIRDTLDSIFGQRYSNLESIVVDGGSSDETVEIVRGYGTQVSRLISERDKGPYDAMSKGIAISKGDIVGILNADDHYCRNDVLELVAGAFSDPSIQACWGDLVYVDREDPSRIIRYWRSGPYRPGLFELGWMPPHPSFFVRRSVYETYGQFNPEFKLAADYELLLRLIARHGISTRHIPEILVRMRVGGLSNRSWKNRLVQNLECHRAGRINGLAMPSFGAYLLAKLFTRLPQYIVRPPKQALTAPAPELDRKRNRAA